MSSRIFVGGLPWATDDAGLREAFESFGEITDARVITDRDTGRSRGFGFVTFSDPEAARAAIENMDGASIGGRSVRVNEAHDKPGRGGGRRGPPKTTRRPRTPGNYRSRGGSYGGGRDDHGGGGGGGGGGGYRGRDDRGGGGQRGDRYGGSGSDDSGFSGLPEAPEEGWGGKSEFKGGRSRRRNKKKKRRGHNDDEW